MDKLLGKQLKYISLIILVLGTVLIISNSNYHIPGNNEGYQPEQPIKFSHQVHAGELKISCVYCHFGAERSRHAGIPAASICMNCHKFVIASSDALNLEEIQAEKEGRDIKTVVSPEILKIYTALGYDEQLKTTWELPEPIEWTKIHNLADYVFFSHQAHNNAGVECNECHGEIETMEQVRQVSDLSMGWCLDCHREAGKNFNTAPERTKLLSDCSTCHY